jgi:hypothetical protein
MPAEYFDFHSHAFQLNESNILERETIGHALLF